jgi:hypothetical protein
MSSKAHCLGGLAAVFRAVSREPGAALMGSLMGGALESGMDY